MHSRLSPRMALFNPSTQLLHIGQLIIERKKILLRALKNSFLQKRLYFLPDTDAFADVVDTVMWPAIPDGELVKDVTVEKGDVGNGLFNFTVTMEPFNCGDNFGLFRESHTQVYSLAGSCMRLR